MTKEIIESKTAALRLIGERWTNEKEDLAIVVVFLPGAGPCLIYNEADDAVTVVRKDDNGVSVTGSVVGAAVVMRLAREDGSNMRKWLDG